MPANNLTHFAAQTDGKGPPKLAEIAQNSAGISRRGRTLGLMMLFVGMASQLLLLLPAAKARSYAFPLRASGNGHYLVDQNGTPFRIHGDAAWSLIAQLTFADVQTYLSDRQSRGFNLALVNLLEHKFAVNAPADRSGDYPFTVHQAGGYNFSTPNPAYFAFVDQVLSAAASRGIVVLLDVMYLGYQGDDEGWWTELTNSVNTQAVCYAYGQYLGNRYKNQGNIIWMLGADFMPPAGSEGEARLHKMLEGIRSTGAPQPATADWNGGTISTDDTAFRDVDLIGAYDETYQTYYQGGRAYAFSPAKPAYFNEDLYENEYSSTRSEVREEQWWAELSTIGGVIFGGDPIWSFNAPQAVSFMTDPSITWQAELGFPGSLDFEKLGAFFNSVAWWKLAPDNARVTKGRGSGETYVTAAAANDGTLFVAYVPPAHQGSITIDMTAMRGAARARWYDPTAGTYVDITGGAYTVSNTGTQKFSTPSGSNSSGANDWTLVLDAR